MGEVRDVGIVEDVQGEVRDVGIVEDVWVK